MSKYKVVKDKEYATVYYVFKLCIGYWKHMGNISTYSKKEEDIVAKAKELVAPKTIYFDA